MNIFILDAFVLLATAICLRSWLDWRKRRVNSFPLAPGPKGLPIIGNVLDMPGEDEWETVRKWGETYGDLVYITIFGTRYLFLNSHEAAVELFERRGGIYSGRPRTTMVELEGWSEWFTSVIPYGDRLRRSRQYFNKFFQRSVVKNYYETQTQTTHKLLLRLLQEPVEYRERIKHWAAEGIIKVTYGFEIAENDPNVELIDKGVRSVSDALGFSAVNTLPALRYLPRWFPGVQFHRSAEEGRSLSAAMQNEPYNDAKKKSAEGKATPSMLSKLVQLYVDHDGNRAEEDWIAKTVAVAYTAGGDTICRVNTDIGYNI